MARSESVAEELLRECVARQEEGEDFDDIYRALLRAHEAELAAHGKVLTARGAVLVRSIPLKGGDFALIFDETRHRWSVRPLAQ
jgi:hypothetical protein